jgi:uncharacterized protein (DUF2249 family)
MTHSATGARVLDVRTIPPVERHARIFATLDELGPGESLELVNDHDPKPLYYQLQAEQPGRFTWTYVESGPTVWHIRVGRASGAATERGSEAAS